MTRDPVDPPAISQCDVHVARDPPPLLCSLLQPIHVTVSGLCNLECTKEIENAYHGERRKIRHMDDWDKAGPVKPDKKTDFTQRNMVQL